MTPKAQPPRKRSGKRTARHTKRWKVKGASLPPKELKSLRPRDSGGRTLTVLRGPMSEATENLKNTSLHDRHVALGARMVPFAGYNMPVQYEGVLAEHKWTRASAGLFDVSHMGQARLTGEGAIATVEALTPT